MKIKVDIEFIGISESISNAKKSEKEWVLIESSDMFQTENYCGGFDATEMEFCFSYYDKDGQEYWFQLPLSDIDNIKKGILKELIIRKAD